MRRSRTKGAVVASSCDLNSVDGMNGGEYFICTRRGAFHLCENRRGCIFLTVLLAGVSSTTVVFDVWVMGSGWDESLNLSEFSTGGMRLEAIAIPSS